MKDSSAAAESSPANPLQTPMAGDGAGQPSQDRVAPSEVTKGSEPPSEVTKGSDSDASSLSASNPATLSRQSMKDSSAAAESSPANPLQAQMAGDGAGQPSQDSKAPREGAVHEKSEDKQPGRNVITPESSLESKPATGEGTRSRSSVFDLDEKDDEKDDEKKDEVATGKLGIQEQNRINEERKGGKVEESDGKLDSPRDLVGQLVNDAQKEGTKDGSFNSELPGKHSEERAESPKSFQLGDKVQGGKVQVEERVEVGEQGKSVGSKALGFLEGLAGGQQNVMLYGGGAAAGLILILAVVMLLRRRSGKRGGAGGDYFSVEMSEKDLEAQHGVGGESCPVSASACVSVPMHADPLPCCSAGPNDEFSFFAKVCPPVTRAPLRTARALVRRVPSAPLQVAIALQLRWRCQSRA